MHLLFLALIAILAAPCHALMDDSGGSSSASGGGVTVGDAVSGGTNSTVLYKDSSGDVASSSSLTFDGSSLGLTLIDFGDITATARSCGPNRCLDLEGFGSGSFRLYGKTGFSGQVTLSSNVYTSGGDPVDGGCGTSPTMTGNNMAMKITVGSGDPNECFVGFATTWITTPICVATGSDPATPVFVNSALSDATSLTLDWADSGDLSGDVIFVHCFGDQ